MQIKSFVAKRFILVNREKKITGQTFTYLDPANTKKTHTPKKVFSTIYRQLQCQKYLLPGLEKLNLYYIPVDSSSSLKSRKWIFKYSEDYSN